MGFSAKLLCAVIAAISLSNCAYNEATPPSRAIVEVTTHAGSGCTPDDLQDASALAASHATLERGYGGYVVVAQGSADEFRELGGAQPTARPARAAGETEDHVQIVMMLHTADPDFGKATDARKMLGPQWSSIVRRGFLVPCAMT